MHNILCSTGFIGMATDEKDYRQIFQYAPTLRCDGFEFMMYRIWYDQMEEVGRELNASEILFPVFHAEKSIGERISRNEDGDVEASIENFKKNCWLANRIGAGKLVLHLWGGLPSDRDIENNFRQLPELCEIAKSYDLVLTIENVVCNQKNPMSHLSSIRERFPEATFTYDTKMAAFHSELEWVYEPEWAWLWQEHKIQHLHVSDYGGGHMDWSRLKALPLGDGQIDFDRFFQNLKTQDYHGDVTMEATSRKADGSMDIDKMNYGLDYIRMKMTEKEE